MKQLRLDGSAVDVAALGGRQLALLTVEERQPAAARSVIGGVVYTQGRLEGDADGERVAGVGVPGPERRVVGAAVGRV